MAGTTPPLAVVTVARPVALDHDDAAAAAADDEDADDADDDAGEVSDATAMFTIAASSHPCPAAASIPFERSNRRAAHSTRLCSSDNGFDDGLAFPCYLSRAPMLHE